MGFGDDEEILQDFLVEVGEILESLSEQLVDLEQSPDDTDLLNAIFRGFHTVKGGAGFLQLNAMVDCCHVTENLFDILRTGKRTVTPELMDVVLEALDTINQQFSQLSHGEALTPAAPELIAALERLVSGDDQPESAVAPAGDVSAPGPGADEDITDEEFDRLLDAISDIPVDAAGDNTADKTTDVIDDDEFEALLDELHGQGKGPGRKEAGPKGADSTATTLPQGSGNDDIADDEFEALLDELHGKGRGPGPTSAPSASAVPESATPTTSLNDESMAQDNISDDEFEALLDELHGKGKAPSVPAAAAGQSVQLPVPQSGPAAAKAPASKAGARASTKPSRENNRGEGGGEATVRVDTQRLDDIMNMVGELVLVRNRMVHLGEHIQDEALARTVSNLDVVTADLQAAVMKTRMQPIKKVFGRFPRVVRDLARSLNKDVALEMIGEDTDLDKNLVEALADPLVHLVRNSVDHGIEMPDVREAAGKPRRGKVVLSAQQEGDHILLSIADDGAGMDPVKLRSLAVSKGLMDVESAERLSDTEAFGLIFAPGFSTKKEISDVSGRGVGMDVVKTKIAQLNGTVEIDSKLGQGTRLNIKVPLTLAIMPTLMVTLADQAFALPLANVQEIFHMDLTKSHVVDGQECVSVRESAIPIFYLKDWLVKDAPRAERTIEAQVVIVTVGTQLVGFVVDQLLGQEEVVIKPLGKMLQGTPGMAGATITGDGTIALILDVPGLLKRYGQKADNAWRRP